MNYSRDIIVDRYRQRISSGKRTKLQKDELLDLINVFVENLATLTTKTKIKTLCTAEIALLEEGYPKLRSGIFADVSVCYQGCQRKWLSARD